jgi:hypothetical protein
MMTNLGWAVLGALPVGCALVVLSEALQTGLSDNAFRLWSLAYVVALWPVMIGSLLHSWILVLLSRVVRVSRIVAALASPSALGVLLVVVWPPYLWGLRVPLGCALALYLLVIRLPAPRAGSAHESTG